MHALAHQRCGFSSLDHSILLLLSVLNVRLARAMGEPEQWLHCSAAARLELEAAACIFPLVNSVCCSNWLHSTGGRLESEQLWVMA
jgi:hypothetical protein